MINRRSVSALHRACLHLIHEPEQRKPDGILHPKPLKTDMTDGLVAEIHEVCPSLRQLGSYEEFLFLAKFRQIRYGRDTSQPI
jgi:hypothetical protein